MLVEHCGSDVVGFFHLPITTLDGDNIHASRFHRVFEAKATLLAVECGRDSFDNGYLIVRSKASGQHFTNFSRAGAIIGSDKRHVQPGLLKDLCIELVIDVNHKNTRILSAFQHGDQSFGIGRSDDDGINSPRDHLLHQVHLLSKIRFIFDAVDD